MKKKKPSYIDKKVDVKGKSIPLRIYSEYRTNVRVSLGKDYVILRIPFFIGGNHEKHVDFAINWLERLSHEKPTALHKYDAEKYHDDFTFTIMGEFPFTTEIVEEDRENGLVEMFNGNHLKVTIPAGASLVMRKKMIRTLISRVIARRFKKLVLDRVQYWNTMFFKKEIKGVSLKYNASNWGSCSVNNNINLSTRSLLLPVEVFDYIVVHELSHLVEMNHSEKFWNVVRNVMPDYERMENWLKKNGSKLDF